MELGWSQDYEEYAFQEDIHNNEYDMFTRQVRAKKELSLAHCVNNLPAELRLHILNYLRELLTYGNPTLPILFQMEFFVWHREEMNNWAKMVYSHNCAYPLCRGYCLNCGEPAQQLRCVDPEKRWRRSWRYRLPLNTLALMNVCYFCICMGYDFDKETKQVNVPSYTRNRDRNIHYPNITRVLNTINNALA